MVTIAKQNIQIEQRRELAARQLDDWRKRNAEKLRGWRPTEVLKLWREKRWSSSMHR